MKNFEEFRSEIIARAKSAGACTDEYKRAYNSDSFYSLFKVIGDNFYWCCDNKVIDCELLLLLDEEILQANNFFVNKSTSSGFLLASGSATVRASGSATVEASGSATVEAYGSATVRASGSATVEASGSAYINSYSSIDHKVSESAILRYYHEGRIVLGEKIKL